jgi:hypothetical protein
MKIGRLFHWAKRTRAGHDPNKNCRQQISHEKNENRPGWSNSLAQKSKVGTLLAEDYSTAAMAQVARKTEPGRHLREIKI